MSLSGPDPVNFLLSFLLQCISPGLVETEFGPRMNYEDPATSKYYKKLPVSLILFFH